MEQLEVLTHPWAYCVASQSIIIVSNYEKSKTRFPEQLHTPVSLRQKYEAGIKMLHEYVA